MTDTFVRLRDPDGTARLVTLAQEEQRRRRAGQRVALLTTIRRDPTEMIRRVERLRLGLPGAPGDRPA